MTLPLAVEKIKEVYVLRPSGEVTAIRELKVLPTKEEECLQQGGRDFVLDLSDVSFLDSSGLGSFFGIFKRIRALNGRLIVASVPQRLEKLLSVMNFSSIVPVKGTVDEAIASFHE